jgi:hypothetical protein
LAAATADRSRELSTTSLGSLIALQTTRRRPTSSRGPREALFEELAQHLSTGLAVDIVEVTSEERMNVGVFVAGEYSGEGTPEGRRP